MHCNLNYHSTIFLSLLMIEWVNQKHRHFYRRPRSVDYSTTISTIPTPRMPTPPPTPVINIHPHYSQPTPEIHPRAHLSEHGSFDFVQWSRIVFCVFCHFYRWCSIERCMFLTVVSLEEPSIMPSRGLLTGSSPSAKTCLKITSNIQQSPTKTRKPSVCVLCSMHFICLLKKVLNQHAN